MEKVLELIKKYQRPVRTVLWSVLIVIAFVTCLYSSKPCNEGFITEAIGATERLINSSSFNIIPDDEQKKIINNLEVYEISLIQSYTHI